MQNYAVVALALLESASAFQAPAMKASSRAVGATMFSEGDIGVLPPLGVYDPLGLIETRNMARYEVMEIKHGRAAMLGFLHVILIEAGVRFPTSECAAAPAGLLASLESMPTAAWLQIMLTTWCACAPSHPPPRCCAAAPHTRTANASPCHRRPAHGRRGVLGRWGRRQAVRWGRQAAPHQLRQGTQPLGTGQARRGRAWVLTYVIAAGGGGGRSLRVLAARVAG